jgi:serine/threonine protein kinase
MLVDVAYLVLEYIGGGELFYYIKVNPFSIEICRYYYKQLADVVKFIHDKGFAHRDIKT